jgi:hypothetical protein
LISVNLDIKLLIFWQLPADQKVPFLEQCSEIGESAPEEENALVRIMGETPPASFQHLQFERSRWEDVVAARPRNEKSVRAESPFPFFFSRAARRYIRAVQWLEGHY